MEGEIGDLIAYNIDNKITVVSKNSVSKNSEIVANKHDTEIPQENIYLHKKDRKLLLI